MKTGRFRRSVQRGRQRYSVCGLRVPPATVPLAPARLALWFPIALLAVVAFSAYIAGRPPIVPEDAQHRAPFSTLARYNFDDFVSAMR